MINFLILDNYERTERVVSTLFYTLCAMLLIEPASNPVWFSVAVGTAIYVMMTKAPSENGVLVDLLATFLCIVFSIFIVGIFAGIVLVELDLEYILKTDNVDYSPLLKYAVVMSPLLNKWLS